MDGALMSGPCSPLPVPVLTKAVTIGWHFLSPLLNPCCTFFLSWELFFFWGASAPLPKPPHPHQVPLTSLDYLNYQARWCHTSHHMMSLTFGLFFIFSNRFFLKFFLSKNVYPQTFFLVYLMSLHFKHGVSWWHVWS
jgi:hypothetical protein